MRIVEQSAIIESWNKMDLLRRVERAARLCYGRERPKEPGNFVKALVEKKHFSPLEFARISLHGSLFTESSVNMRDLRRLAICKPEEYAPFVSLVNEAYPEFFEDIIGEMDERDLSRDKDAFSWRPQNTWVPVIITTNRAVSHQLVRHRYNIAIMQASQRFIRMDEVDFIRPSAYFEPNTRHEDNWIDAMTEAEHNYAFALENGHPAQAARLFLTNSAATKILIYASIWEWGYIFKLRCSEKADPMMRALMCPLRDEFLRRDILDQDFLDNVGRYW